MDSATRKFLEARPEYHKTEENSAVMVGALCKKHLGRSPLGDDSDMPELADKGFWSVDEFVKVYDSLTAVGLLAVKPGGVKELSRAELEEVALTISLKGSKAGILRYLTFSLGQLNERSVAAETFLLKHRALCERAAAFVFAHLRPDFNDSKAWRRFLRHKMEGRHSILTVDLLAEMWEQFPRSPQATVPSKPVTKPEPQTDFRALPEAEFQDAYARARAAFRKA